MSVHKLLSVTSVAWAGPNALRMFIEGSSLQLCGGCDSLFKMRTRRLVQSQNKTRLVSGEALDLKCRQPEFKAQFIG